MSDIVYLGLKARQLEDSPAYQPISCVKLTIGGEDANGNPIVCTAGNPKSGRTIETSSPLIWDKTVGNTVAQNILSAVQGYVYQPYTADGALLNPVAEIGDAVEVGDIYSVIADVDTTFSPLMSATISAPVGSDIDHEYPYESSENREIAQQIQGLKTSFIVENGRIAAEISDMKATEKGLASKITSLEVTVDGIHAYTEEDIQTISGGVVSNWAEAHFTADEISTMVSSYFDAAGAADTALTSSKTYTDGKIQPIEGQYTSAIEQSAKSIKQTVAAQESKWDISELPAGVTISAWGYGRPTDNGYPASEHAGEYYLNQSTGYYWYSDGTRWTSQEKLNLITSNLSTQITTTANGLESVVENTIPGLQREMTRIEQTATSISLSVSPSILRDANGQPVNEYGWPVDDESQYVYTGGTDFTITGEGITATTETVDLHVKAVNIDGTIYANAVEAGTYIDSPRITGGSISSATISSVYILGGYFADTLGNVGLTIGYSGYDAGAMELKKIYDPYVDPFFRILWNMYGTYLELGGTTVGRMDSGVFYPSGEWDFSNATVRGLPE